MTDQDIIAILQDAQAVHLGECVYKDLEDFERVRKIIEATIRYMNNNGELKL